MSKENTNGSSMPTVQTSGSTINIFDPATFDMAQRMAKLYSMSDLVPTIYRYKATGNVEQDEQAKSKAMGNIVIALDMAQRMGANPLAVMQNMYIVQGHPSWSSSFLIATVNTCGRYMPLRFQMGQDGYVIVAGKKHPNLTCYAWTIARGADPNDDRNMLIGTIISMDMANKEGWTSKNGSKWITMPEQMLMYRAASFWIRTYAPELANGMHTTEEVQDCDYADYEEVPTTHYVGNAPCVGDGTSVTAKAAEMAKNAVEKSKRSAVEQNNQNEHAEKKAPQYPFSGPEEAEAFRKANGTYFKDKEGGAQ
jgi:hypothetical protein